MNDMNEFDNIIETNEDNDNEIIITQKKKKKKGIFLLFWGNLKWLIPVVIIIVGISIIFSPWYNARRLDKIQNQAMNMWRDAITNGDIIPPDGIINSNSNSNGNGTGNWSSATAVIGDFVNDEGIWEEDVDPTYDFNYLLNRMEGVLTIEKINLKSVILKPAVKQNLDISVCAVLPDRIMGQTGNYILAGHYSQIYGRHFNRIKEVVAGDIITMDNGYELFNYQVIETFSVKPEEVWVMNNDDARKLITLITCDYATYPYNRWIVKGEIIE